ncbi:MAG: DUF2301 domain-containing membrane protein [Myxococcota bacterium]
MVDGHRRLLVREGPFRIPDESGDEVADPGHVELLDTFDRATVGLYRAGLVTASAATSGLGAALVLAPDHVPLARFGVLVATALIVADLHLYARTIRYTISVAGWAAAVLVGATAVAGTAVAPWLADAALGFSFVVFSAVALKERYCFRLPVVVAVPPTLALALVPLRLGWPVPAAVLLGAGGLVIGVLAVAKLRMPLHYDIGDKRKYEV